MGFVPSKAIDLSGDRQIHDDDEVKGKVVPVLN
jgi:hypothetical protein